MLKTILEQVQVLLDPADSVLYLVDEECGELVPYPENPDRCGMNASTAGGIAGRVIRTGRSIVTENGPAHSQYSIDVDLKTKRGCKAILCVPISSGDNILGGIEVLGEKFTRTNKDLLRTIADFAAVAIENSKYVAKINELTVRDDLTGLYNDRQLGRTLEMEIRRAERYEEEFSMVFIDLDRFKEVNDTYGHPVGSRVLKETGHLIGKELREDIDTAFRYGGDEFVLILPRTGTDGAMVVAERIQSLLGKRLFTSDDGRHFNLTASFGIATFPRDATTREDILRMADEAMYEAKGKGRDGIIVYATKQSQGISLKT